MCQGSLAQGGYFLKDDKYYCKKDYEILFGIKCKACGQYVEGRVVTALGNTYHPRCFTCDRCRYETLTCEKLCQLFVPVCLHVFGIWLLLYNELLRKDRLILYGCCAGMF